MRPWAMMIACASLLLLAPAGSEAAEPAGTASGYYLSESGERIEFRHALAVRTDEADQGRPETSLVRLLLSDRPLPAEVSRDDIRTAARGMAERGEMRGLMIEFDPADRSRMHVAELDVEASRFGSFLSSRGDSGELWKRLSTDGGRLAGEYEAQADDFWSTREAAFAFDTPVSYDPVETILTGADARGSEFVSIAVRRLEALLANDLDAAAALTARPAAPRPIPSAEQMAAMREFLVETAAMARNPTRIVVRRDTAMIVSGDDSARFRFELVREDGEWKMAR